MFLVLKIVSLYSMHVYSENAEFKFLQPPVGPVSGGIMQVKFSYWAKCNLIWMDQGRN